MNIELNYKEKSFEFNISPLMPIAYLRRIAIKSFKIPENLIELKFNGMIIEKKYNETYLKDYFNNNKSKIKINVIENNYSSFYIKADNFNKLIDKDLIKKKYLNNFIKEKKIGKCNICNENIIEYFCRENIKFICSNCKKKYKDFKFLEIKNYNFEQLGNLYKKQLINELEIEEENLRILIKKHKRIEINKLIDELYKFLNKVLNQEKNFLEFYPCIPLENIINTNFKEMKKKIYSIENNSKDKFNYKDKKEFFLNLQKEDFIIDNLRKDIKSIEKKYNLQDLFIKILESYLDKLKNLSEELNNLWEEKRNNFFNFINELEDLIETQKKNFNLENYYKKNFNTSFNEKDFEEILFNKKNKVLNISRNLPILKNYSNTYEKNLSEDLNFLINDLDSSSESFYSLKGYKSIKNSEKNIKRSSILKLDKKLLNEEQLSLFSNNNSGRKSSIRMSIFVQNKMKMNNILSPSKLMKLKKKKKKII